MDDRLRGALAGHYDIDREIGRGGMATVYLARDVKHDRQVAIKVLHPELAASVGSTRFLREIDTIARLTHPHILSLHDSGDRDGTLYYVMPFVEGESLRERLTRERQLPLRDAVTIASDVADALVYAHAHGVLHRDIKPENILLSGRHAIVADFGIARAVEKSAGATLTETGITLGTPHYMSPEQASGERDLDGRSDVYALGCVLYEMLAGEPPYGGATMQAIVAKHMTAEVPSLRTLRPSVPPRLDEIVRRALSKNAADRQPSAAAFLRELEALELTGESDERTAAAPAARSRSPRRKGPLWIALPLLVAVAAIAVWRFDSRGDSGGARLQSLAILPFDAVGIAPESTYFADGITEEIIDAVGRLPGLRVISRTSAFAFRDKRGLTLQQIADSLKVGAILEGSVRRDGNRLRIIARLIDVRTDSQLLARDFNREMRDVFAVQNEIARDIANLLRVQLAPGQATQRGVGTTNLIAYDLYLRGRVLWNQRTPPALREAISLFEQAIAHDSNFVAAYVGLSDALRLAGLIGGAPPYTVAQRSLDVAQHAWRLDSLEGGAHAAMGHALYEFFGDTINGALHLRRALELDSVSYGARLYLGIMRHDLGDFAEAIQLIRDAYELDPLAAPVRANLGRIYLSAGQYDSAEAHLRAAMSLSPRWSSPKSWLGHTLLAKGQPDAAMDMFRQAAAVGGAMDSVWLAFGLASTGDKAAARAIVETIASGPRERLSIESGLAIAYSALDDWDAAIRWLQQEPQEGVSIRKHGFLRMPSAARLRAHPRYIAIAPRYGYPR